MIKKIEKDKEIENTPKLQELEREIENKETEIKKKTESKQVESKENTPQVASPKQTETKTKNKQQQTKLGAKTEPTKPKVNHKQNKKGYQFKLLTIPTETNIPEITTELKSETQSNLIIPWISSFPSQDISSSISCEIELSTTKEERNISRGIDFSETGETTLTKEQPQEDVLKRPPETTTSVVDTIPKSEESVPNESTSIPKIVEPTAILLLEDSTTSASTHQNGEISEPQQSSPTTQLKKTQEEKEKEEKENIEQSETQQSEEKTSEKTRQRKRDAKGERKRINFRTK